MLKSELIKKLQEFDDDHVVIIQDEDGQWDNIQEIHDNGTTINIVFGGGSAFSDE